MVVFFRKIFRQARSIARLEIGFFLRRYKLMWSVAAVALIPSLYTVIYLSSLWDPASHSQALKVGIVNLDQGVVFQDKTFSVGQELINNLQSAPRFDYQRVASADEARQQVRQGSLAFALIIPQHFSANAVPGAQPGAGQLVVFASQGNQYETARIAQLFATELGHKVNESLNAQRWSLVLTNAAGSKNNVTRLHEGITQLHEGSQELSLGAAKALSGAKSISDAATQLDGKVSQMSSGMKQLGAGLRTMDAQRPRNSELNRLDAGASALVSGLSDLGLGLKGLKSGSRDLNSNVALFKEEADSSLLVRPSVRESVTQVSVGLLALDQGLQTAAEGEQKIQEGARSLSTGVSTLTAGVRTMNSAVRSTVTQFPDDNQLDNLDTGATDLARATIALAQGNEKISVASKRLEIGLELIRHSIPNVDEEPQGSAEGLADSVRPFFEVDAAVQNNGIGFIANVIPAALWLGAGIAVFFVNLRVLPKHAKPFHPAAQLLGKVALPSVIILAQGVVVLLTVFAVLQVDVVHPGALVFTVLSAGFAFFYIIAALIRFLGDAGKVVAMLLLAVQLTASGGAMPVELSGSFFATLSPWLPITWLGHGLKAALFGAFEGAWALPWLQVSCVGLVAAILTVVFGQWRFVSLRQLRPQLDL
ncbi:MAG: YhgE/Pip domain-containing protein [Comamonadaceae bacterium]